MDVIIWLIILINVCKKWVRSIKWQRQWRIYLHLLIKNDCTGLKLCFVQDNPWIVWIHTCLNYCSLNPRIQQTMHGQSMDCPNPCFELNATIAVPTPTQPITHSWPKVLLCPRALLPECQDKCCSLNEYTFMYSNTGMHTHVCTHWL